MTPAGANDYFFYLKNTGLSTLLIPTFRMDSSVITKLTIEIVSGTPTYDGATAITPVDRNTGKFLTPSATINQDADITSLVSEGEPFFMLLDTADKLFTLDIISGLIIAPGGAIAMKRVAATGAITGDVSLMDIGVIK